MVLSCFVVVLFLTVCQTVFSSDKCCGCGCVVGLFRLAFQPCECVLIENSNVVFSSSLLPNSCHRHCISYNFQEAMTMAIKGQWSFPVFFGRMWHVDSTPLLSLLF